jgi:hypothetical protein
MGIMLTPWGAWDKMWPPGGHGEARKGLEGRGAAAAQGRRPCVAAEPPESPVFGAAANAPK